MSANNTESALRYFKGTALTHGCYVSLACTPNLGRNTYGRTIVQTNFVPHGYFEWPALDQDFGKGEVGFHLGKTNHTAFRKLNLSLEILKGIGGKGLPLLKRGRTTIYDHEITIPSNDGCIKGKPLQEFFQTCFGCQ